MLDLHLTLPFVKYENNNDLINIEKFLFLYFNFLLLLFLLLLFLLLLMLIGLFVELVRMYFIFDI